MKRLVGGDYQLDLSPIEIEESVDGETYTSITDKSVLDQLTGLKAFIGKSGMIKPIWIKLLNGETDELIVARGTLAVVDEGEFEINIPLKGFLLTIAIVFTQMLNEDDEPLDDWYIDTNDAKYLLISDAQAIGNIEELPVFENIVDKDGHKRFVEGNGAPAEIEGVTPSFCKWSLSGSHLMVVYSGTIADGTTVPYATPFARFALPSWVMGKIVPVLSNLIANKKLSVFNNQTYVETEYAGYFDKASETIDFYLYANLTPDYDGNFRIQFDLLIDNEETPAP